MGKLAGTMAVCATALALCCGSASGAGIITHAWMADDARAYVEHPALKALLDANPQPLRDEIIDALAGNYCRCTAYEPIITAIEDAAGRLAGNGKEAQS